MTRSAGRYVVMQESRSGVWRLLGEASRRPGLPARKSRAQAVLDVLGRDPREGEVFVVLPRSEWQLGLDH